MKLARIALSCNRAALLVTLVHGLAACSSTRLASKWKNPDHEGPPLRRVAVFVMTEDEIVEHLAEDHLVQGFPRGTRAEAGSKLVPESVRGDSGRVRDWLLDHGFDGALVLRLLAVDTTGTYVPPAAYGSNVPYYYGSFGGYYGHFRRETSRPGRVQVTTRISMESVLYDLAERKLLWSATSETFDPASIEEIIVGVEDVVIEELVAGRLIGPAPE